MPGRDRLSMGERMYPIKGSSASALRFPADITQVSISSSRCQFLLWGGGGLQSKTNNKGRKGGFLLNRILSRFLLWNARLGAGNKQHEHHSKAARIFSVCCFYFSKSPVKWGFNLTKECLAFEVHSQRKMEIFNCRAAFVISVSHHACLPSPVFKSHHSLHHPFIHCRLIASYV